MELLHVEIRGKPLFALRSVEVAFAIGGFRIAKLPRSQFPRRQESVVVFQFQDAVIVLLAKVFESSNGIPIEVVSELKVGIELDHKSERRRNVLVDLRNHQTRTELR